jgi:ankyrin repeat protein
MSAAAAATKTSTTSPPLPQGLAKTHPFPRTPWKISEVVFARIKAQAPSAAKFQSCVLEQTDPEAAFVLAHFLAQKPPHLGIKSIQCIHNSIQTQAFEGAFLSMEQEAGSMPPIGQNEEPKAARALVLRRWKEATSQFPLVEMEKRGTLTQANVLPLWHGTRHAEAICTSGFTFFGKHHFFDKNNAKAGSNASTDIGYFGSGIYFTNSAHYASMYNPDTLLLTWVTMREPYPVVNDVPIPKKGKDMIKLQGNHAYQNYNAHYIPVTSVDPTNPDNMVYHPCYGTEVPAWDEYVVFNKFQALPRFQIELEVDFPKAPSYKPPEQPNHKTGEPPKKVTVQPLTAVAPAPTDPMELVFQMHTKIWEQQLAAEKAKKEIESASGSAAASAGIPHPQALHDAAKNGDVATLNKLLVDTRYLARLESRDKEGLTPLLAAAKNCQHDAVILLIKSGAKVNATIPHTAPERLGWNALHLAISSGSVASLAVVETLLLHKAQLLEGKTINEETPLLIAARHGNDSALVLLIGAGANVTATDKEGRTALHWAVIRSNPETVRALLPYKAQLLNVKDKLGSTALEGGRKTAHLYGYSALLQYEECEKLILAIPAATTAAAGSAGSAAAAAKPFYTSQFYPDAFHFAIDQAAAAGELAHLKALFADKRYLAILDSPNKIHTPLTYAADRPGYNVSHEFAQVIPLLIQAGANVAIPNAWGDNIFHIAASRGNDWMIKDLLPSNAQLLEAKNSKGRTALLQAATMGRGSTVVQLINAGASVTAIDNDGRNALHLAVSSSGVLADQIAEWNDRRFDLSAEQIRSKNSLDLITYSTELIKALLPYKEELLEGRDKEGNTPLLKAVLFNSGGSPLFATLLINAGADVTAKNKAGKKAIHLTGHKDVVNLLKKADPSACIVM